MIVTRFAPSPSFFAHLGHLRGLLILKKLSEKGLLYLRLDDTGEDEHRPQYIRSFLALFRKYHIKMAGIMRTKTRSEVYLAEVKRLLGRNDAYVCGCVDTLDKKYRDNCECGLHPTSWKDMTPDKVVRLRSARQVDYVILRYNKTHSRYTPTLVFQTAIDDKALGVNFLFRGSDLQSSEMRLREIYAAVSGSSTFPITRYWGRIRVGDGQTDYELSKSARKNPSEIPGIVGLEKSFSKESIERFLLSYGATKNNIRVDLKKLRAISRSCRRRGTPRPDSESPATT